MPRNIARASPARENRPKGHQFLFDLAAHDPDGKLLPEIQGAPMAPAGTGGHQVQAYNFRLILTQDPANEFPIQSHSVQTPTLYALLAKYDRKGTHTTPASPQSSRT